MKSAAEKDATTSRTDTTIGRVLQVGDFGLGAGPLVADNPNSLSIGNDCDLFVKAGFFEGVGAGTNFRIPTAPIIVLPRRGGGDGTGQVSQLQMSASVMSFRYREANIWSNWRDVYHTGNTTKGSDGTLKTASPVARIASPDSSIRSDIDEDSFEWAGYGVANDKARGIEVIRDDIGVYRLIGAKSLASSGWRLLPPRDPDGSGDLGVVTAEQLDDEIIISLFRRKMVLADGEIVIQPGEPIDVPANSWIDVRLDMPESVIPPDSPAEEPQIQPE